MWILWAQTPILGPDIGNPFIKKTANNWKTARDREKVTIEHISKTGAELAESAVILVAMSTWVGETLHRTRQRLV